MSDCTHRILRTTLLALLTAILAGCGSSSRSADREPVGEEALFVALSRDPLGQRSAIHLFSIQDAAWIEWMVGATTTDIWLDSNDRWERSLTGTGIGAGARLNRHPWPVMASALEPIDPTESLLGRIEPAFTVLSEGPNRAVYTLPLDGEPPLEFRSSVFTPGEIDEGGLRIRDAIQLPLSAEQTPLYALSRNASTLDSTLGDDVLLVEHRPMSEREDVVIHRFDLGGPLEVMGPEMMTFGLRSHRLFVGLTRTLNSAGIPLETQDGAIAVLDPIGRRVVSFFALPGLRGCGEVRIASSELERNEDSEPVEARERLFVACSGDPTSLERQRATAGVVSIDVTTSLVGVADDDARPDPTLVIDRIWRAQDSPSLLPSRGLLAMPGETIVLLVSDGESTGEDVLFALDMESASVLNARVMAQPRRPDSDAFRMGNPALGPEDPLSAWVAVPLGQPGLQLLSLFRDDDGSYRFCPFDPECNGEPAVLLEPIPTRNGFWVREVQGVALGGGQSASTAQRYF